MRLTSALQPYNTPVSTGEYPYTLFTSNCTTDGAFHSFLMSVNTPLWQKPNNSHHADPDHCAWEWRGVLLRTQYQESSAKNQLGFRWCRGLGNQLQQNSSGTSQKAIMGAMISRHQAGVEYQKQRGVCCSPVHWLVSWAITGEKLVAYCIDPPAHVAEWGGGNCLWSETVTNRSSPCPEAGEGQAEGGWRVL